MVYYGLLSKPIVYITFIMFTILNNCRIEVKIQNNYLYYSLPHITGKPIYLYIFYLFTFYRRRAAIHSRPSLTAACAEMPLCFVITNLNSRYN